MKYSNSNPPLVCMMKNSTCYKGTTKMAIRGVLWHSTGANNPTLKRYVQPTEGDPNYDSLLKKIGTNTNKNDWNHIERNAGVNAWIGKFADGTVGTVQTMPWDYKPWGCGTGSKGSCNDGWIQFEICEDNLSDPNYFNAVYKEACEFTAFICKKYNIDPHGTYTHNGVVVPRILCHKDSYTLKLGNNHADVLHWFNKYGKTMEDVRDDVADLINPPVVEKEVYRVRKAWNQPETQVGAYSNLNNAKAACDKAGKDYEVYNNAGTAIYPVAKPAATQPKPAADANPAIKEGSVIKLKSGAKYVNGKKVPLWVIAAKLYVRDIQKNGNVVISTQASGAVTGTVSANQIDRVVSNEYKVQITAATLNVRAGAGTNYKVIGTLKKNAKVTVLETKGTWARIKEKNNGWISLNYTKKV